MATITVSIPSELADIYNTASEQDRQKIQVLLSLWLREISSGLSLSEMMDYISDNAQERGLTPEILESLLNDE